MSTTVTQLLLDLGRGDRTALDRLLPLVYNELRNLATRYMRQERSGHTLQPTALIHEAYIRLADQRQLQWVNRAHFFGVAATLMRSILLENARARGAEKRGAGKQKVALDDAIAVSAATSPNLVALDDALKELAEIDPRKSRVIELHYFGGLTAEEMAEVLEVSVRTVGRDLKMAQLWLSRYLNGES